MSKRTSTPTSTCYSLWVILYICFSRESDSGTSGKNPNSICDPNSPPELKWVAGTTVKQWKFDGLAKKKAVIGLSLVKRITNIQKDWWFWMAPRHVLVQSGELYLFVSWPRRRCLTEEGIFARIVGGLTSWSCLSWQKKQDLSTQTSANLGWNWTSQSLFLLVRLYELIYILNISTGNVVNPPTSRRE